MSDRALVLLVEDEAMQQRIIALMTIELDLAVHAVNSGEEAVAALFGAEVLPYRLVLMDYDLPGMDGLECARRIRELEQGSGRRIPIVGMTALGLSVDRQKCIDAGMDDFVNKPLELKSLAELLWSWVIMSHTDKYLK